MPSRKYGCYLFGSATELTDQQLEQFTKLFNEPITPVDSVLGGRASVQINQIPGLGSVVIKHYTRGGLIRHLVKQRYVKWGKTRCQLEYDILNKVIDISVGAPKPVAYAYQGRLCYRCWLVTREIEQQQTLARLSLTDVDRAFAVIGQIADNIATLIQNQILHVDLHPGNVLVDSNSRVYLIDFDKARYSNQNKDKLRDKYLSRWGRAVIKHRLPEMLNDLMHSCLGKNYDKD
jgi:3-deoxy-D-manno-octulosonic acid kinase